MPSKRRRTSPVSVVAQQVTPPDQEQRLRILNDLDTNMLVEAAAGTGKTTSMVQRMVALIREGKSQIETIAAVTFTRKAASELRARFQSALESAVRDASGADGERLNHALQHVQRCFIGTIHAFCGRLLRERPVEAGVDPEFQELEEDVDARLRETAWIDFTTQLFADEDPVLDELAGVGLDVDRLKDAFLHHVEYPDVTEWPSDATPFECAQLRDETEGYLRHIRDLVPTLPASRGNDKLMDLYEFIDRRARRLDLSSVAGLMDLVMECRCVAVTQKCWPQGARQGREERDRWKEYVTSIAEPAQRSWLALRYGIVLKVLQRAAAVYDRLRTDASGLNFQDLLMRAARLLQSSPAIRRYFRGRFTHLLIDEFQDTDPIQAEVMLLLTADDPTQNDWRLCRPISGSLFVVGDPKQSIYRFRRADIVTFNKVREIIEATGGEVVPLTANFRSLKSLVSWVNQRFEAAFPAEATRYAPQCRSMDVGWSVEEEGDLSGPRMLPVPGELSKKEDAIPYDAEFIARTIRWALDTGLRVPRKPSEVDRGVGEQVRPEDFMIVTRKKTHLDVYARHLQELGIPHQVTGGAALSAVREVDLLCRCLEAITDVENPVPLVAVLRSELFGFSDRILYTFRKAGGRFNIRYPLPDELDELARQQFAPVWERLLEYRRCLSRMPTVVVAERIAAELGLFASAAAGAGGNVQAGTLAKALETMRRSQAELTSPADLVGHLRELIDEKGKSDAVPASPHERSAVRVMNLHQAKGLEAPIVFLADPSGKYEWPPKFFIDRSGDLARGHLQLSEKISEYRSVPIAQPFDWSTLASEESQFQQAEEERLMYVAATRAGSLLVVSQLGNARSNVSYNPWGFFAEQLADCEQLPNPGPQSAPEVKREWISQDDIQAAEAAVTEARMRALAPSYATAAAKALSLRGAEAVPGRSRAQGEAGTEWGTVIHALLETVALQPDANLEALAESLLYEVGADPGYAPAAVRTVQSVTKSEIWQRAMNSEERLVEVPFEYRAAPGSMDSELPLVVRGVIDLAFREPQGWVIVDYKTDASAKEETAPLVRHYRPQVELYTRIWESVTERPVAENGLYFVAANSYVRL